MDDESVLEFNFWPSFADLMLTLVLILVIVIFSVYASLAVGTVNLKTERDNQKKVVNEIAAAFNVKPDSIGPDKYAISITNKTSPDIMIEQHLDVQRFSFSDQILFDRNEFILKPSGITALKVVGGKIKGQLDKIIEIQEEVFGSVEDADTRPRGQRSESSFPFFKHGTRLQQSNSGILFYEGFLRYKSRRSPYVSNLIRRVQTGPT